MSAVRRAFAAVITAVAGLSAVLAIATPAHATDGLVETFAVYQAGLKDPSCVVHNAAECVVQAVARVPKCVRASNLEINILPGGSETTMRVRVTGARPANCRSYAPKKVVLEAPVGDGFQVLSTGL